MHVTYKIFTQSHGTKCIPIAQAVPPYWFLVRLHVYNLKIVDNYSDNLLKKINKEDINLTLLLPSLLYLPNNK